MNEPETIHFERRNGLAVVTLDRPKALNALSREMVQALGRKLAEWRVDDRVKAVLVKAVPGRAFCAGGDIVHVTRLAQSEGVAAAIPFFYDEYRMNWRIKHFPKPYIALIDGITMGGGVGLSVHGTWRVATENTRFAMPETAIGFFPDVGGSYFLPRLDRHLGTYLGVTGARLDGRQARHAGIATHFVPAAGLADLEAALAGADDAAAIERILAAHAEAPGETSLGHDLERIDHLFAAATPAELRARLEADGSEFAAWCLGELETKSPLSVAVTMAELAAGGERDFSACMQLEYRIVHRFLASHDFIEGVRALLVDKDRKPRWQHAHLGAVTEDDVAAFMAPLEGGDLALDWAID